MKYLFDNKYRPESVLHFFDLSILIPLCTEEIHEFKKALPKNVSYFQRNGIELILILKEHREKKEVDELIKEYPFINWKVIIHNQKTKNYNLSKAINKGIDYSSMNYIMVMSPEYEYYTDIIYLLRGALKFYPNHYVVWESKYVCSGEDSIKKISTYQRETIMLEKSFLKQIGGYDEQISWKICNFDLRTRLEFSGIKKLYIPDPPLLYNAETCKEILDPEQILFYHNETLGLKNFANKYQNKCDSEELYYDWHSDRFELNSCKKYLETFVLHSNVSEDVLRVKRNILLLVPTYNESAMISNFIEQSSKHCDGIIFLDDGSSDNTYELILGEKVLLKVKKERQFFNDLYNRNVLLDLASFFNAEWLLFMDVDEQLDNRYCDLAALTRQKKVNVFAFNLVHLWNTPDDYNVLYPQSKDGIVKTYRMFRMIGHLQINSVKVLHFPATPYFINENMDAPILLLHQGNMGNLIREKKYNLYTIEDKKGDFRYSYLFLINDSASLKRIKDISLL